MSLRSHRRKFSFLPFVMLFGVVSAVLLLLDTPHEYNGRNLRNDAPKQSGLPLEHESNRVDANPSSGFVIFGHFTQTAKSEAMCFNTGSNIETDDALITASINQRCPIVLQQYGLESASYVDVMLKNYEAAIKGYAAEDVLGHRRYIVCPGQQSACFDEIKQTYYLLEDGSQKRLSFCAGTSRQCVNLLQTSSGHALAYVGAFDEYWNERDQHVLSQARINFEDGHHRQTP